MNKPFFISPSFSKGGVFLFLILVLTVLVSASHDDCSITNIGPCFEDAFDIALSIWLVKLPELFFSFLLDILNQPVGILLSLLRSLLVAEVNLSLFLDFWAIIIYMLSFFYGLLLLYIGFQFILSGDSPQKREYAKQSLSNTMVMMVLVQSSYYLYALIIAIVSGMTQVIFDMIDPSIFSVAATSVSNAGLQLVLLTPYLIALVSFVIILVIRYIFVACGVVFFPIGIFLYYTGSLRPYGSFILNTLFSVVSLSFIYVIILATASQLMGKFIFNQFPILIPLSAITFIVLITMLISLLVLIKSALTIIKPFTPVVKVAKSFV